MFGDAIYGKGKGESRREPRKTPFSLEKRESFVLSNGIVGGGLSRNASGWGPPDGPP